MMQPCRIGVACRGGLMSQLQQAYITAMGIHLPGAPVSCADMENYLGCISPEASRRGRLALRQNKIKTRHYAIKPDGSSDYTTAKLAAHAVNDLFARAESDMRDVDYLATATTQNDFLVPGLASGVHGELKLPPLEIASFQSVCASSMMALKSAFLQVKAGEKKAALTVGAEFSSRFFRPGFYHGTTALAADHTLSPDAEFLRWTLSDGAGAALVEPRCNRHGLSLRIDWIELRSFADRFETCMSGGMTRDTTTGDAIPWSHAASPALAFAQGAMMLRQDFDLLHAMLPVWVGEFMRLVDTGKISIPGVDWFLCHYSAHSLREEIIRLATRAGCMVPEEKWFTNLYARGNVGAASIFLMLEELLRTKNVQPGQTILCAVPESGRCIMSFMQLTVMDRKMDDA
jgi:3-oxoacyl-[acyl-carrier-protein] synthase III